MRVEDMGYRITEAPGYTMIRVEPSEHTADGVAVMLDEGDDRSCRYGLQELEKLVDALTSALNLGREMAQKIEAQKIERLDRPYV
jgi:hypothetical protein